MYKEGKTANNNAWTSSTTGSLNSCSGCGCGKKKKKETDNQWTSTTKNGDSACGCK